MNLLEAKASRKLFRRKEWIYECLAECEDEVEVSYFPPSSEPYCSCFYKDLDDDLYDRMVFINPDTDIWRVVLIEDIFADDYEIKE